MDTTDLDRCCEEELAAATALQDACARKRQALVAGDPEAISAAAGETVAALRRWVERAESRRRCVAVTATALGAPGTVTLAAVADLMPGATSERLRGRAERLTAALACIQSFNRQNEILARHSLAVINFSLRRLLGLGQVTYGPDGPRLPPSRLLSRGV